MFATEQHSQENGTYRKFDTDYVVGEIQEITVMQKLQILEIKIQ